MTERAKRGAPKKPEHEKVKFRTVRLNDADYEIYKEAGRDRWLRTELRKWKGKQ